MQAQEPLPQPLEQPLVPFTYTLTGVAPCINDTSLATININPQPIAGTDGGVTVCETSTASIDLFGLITGEQNGWSMDTNLWNRRYFQCRRRNLYPSRWSNH